MWYWVDAMRNLLVRPYLLRERSIRGCASYKVRPLLGARDFLSDLFGWPTFDYQSLHWKPASCKNRAAIANFTLHCICEYIYERCGCSLHRTYQTLCISILNVFWMMQVTLLPCSNGRGPMVPEGLPWTSAALVLFHCEEIGHCRRLSSYEKAARKSCSRHWRRCIFLILFCRLTFEVYFSRCIGRGLSVSLFAWLWGIAPLWKHNHHVLLLCASGV